MSIDQSQNSYKNILKGTSVFGGVQVFQILISLIRGKFIAILLGPDGMGINALLTSSTTTIQQFSSIGLGLSIVREVSANADKDRTYCSIILAICRKLLLITGIIGALVCALFSIPLSNWTFGTSDRYHWFIILSVFIFLTTLYNGEMAFLQGYHQTKRLAKSSLIGSLTGLLVGVPLYYFLGINGIPFALIVFALTMYFSYRRYLKSYLGIQPQLLPKQKSLAANRSIVNRLLTLGATLMIASIIGSLTTYIINIFVRNVGTEAQVGLYNAANSITMQYAGVIFTAMALDYFPRLTAINNDIAQQNTVVNRQTEVIALIIAPLATILIISAPIIVKILLSHDFYEAIPLLQTLGLAIYFRAIAYPMGYLSFAKGDKRTFFIYEGIFSNVFNLSCSCIFYHFFGLIGLGYAQIALYFIATIIYYILTKRLYSYVPTSKVLILNSLLAVPVTFTYIFTLTIPSATHLFVTIPVLIIVSTYSIHALASAYCK